MAERTRWEAIGVTVMLAGIGLAVTLPDIGPNARFGIAAACLLAGVLIMVFARPRLEVPPQTLPRKPTTPTQGVKGRPHLIEAENVENIELDEIAIHGDADLLHATDSKKVTATNIRKYPELPAPPVSRNAPCPCGSGKKFKKCHGKK